MAFTTLILEDKNKIIKEVPIGFSWTTCFFSFIVPMIRGDWLYFLIMLVAQICTLGFAGIIFAFVYNKFYLHKLIKDGYKIKSYTPIIITGVKLPVEQEKALIRKKAGVNFKW